MVTHKCLSRRGYVIDRSLLSAEEEIILKKELMIKTTVLPAYRDFQKPKIYPIYYFSDNAYYVPRFYGIAKYGYPSSISIPVGEPINVVCVHEPLKHQVEALEKLYKILDPQKSIGDGGVLSLPCGYGKTFCAIKGACRLGLSTLIIVPTECLMDQWMDAIKTFTNGTVGYIQRDHIDTEHPFVVAMLHSICLKDYPSDLFKRFGLTVFDECHHISSESFCQALLKVRTRFTLGLSATPERRDGLSYIFYQFLGPLLHKEKRAGVNTIYVKSLVCASNLPSYEVLRMSNGTMNTAGMITAVSSFEERNRLIISVLKTLFSQGYKILLLSSRREHLHRFKDMLDILGLKHPQTGKYATYGFYYGKQGSSRNTHKQLLAESSQCDIILGIDAIAKEGLDIPDLNALVLATPAGMDVEQPVGRILRKFHKTLNPVVIDIVDDTGNFVKHYKERQQWYINEDYIIHELNIKLTNKSLPTLTSFLEERKLSSISRPSKSLKPIQELDVNVLYL